MDPLEKLNLKMDSSLRIACELAKLGHLCYLSPIHALSWNSEKNQVSTLASELFFGQYDATQVSMKNTKIMDLSSFSGLHMRKEPPFDMQYIGATWILDAVKNHCKIFNAPNALRSFNEKLGIFRFPEAIKSAFVSSNPQQLLDFAYEVCDGDAIVKPLDQFGGKGIFRLNCTTIEKIDAYKILETETQQGSQIRLIQKFNKDIYDGEIRVFTLGGEPLSWCLKKPSPGNFLANTSAGATIHPYEPGEKMYNMVTRIAKELLSEGVAIIGFDIIGDVISEINITSPRLLQADEDPRNYYEDCATWFESACAAVEFP